MNRKKLWARTLICVLACTAAACSNDLEQKASPVQGEGERITVTATAGMPQDRPSTRLGFEETTEGKLKITWSPIDAPQGPETFSVLTGTAAANPSTFTMQSMDASSATFTGEITPTNGATYYAVYPALPTATAVAPTAVPLDMTGQTGTAPDESKVYMYGSSTYTAGGALNFNFNHLTAIVKVTLSFPTEAGTNLPPNVTIKPLTRTLAGATMTDVTFSAAGGLYAKADADLTASPTTYNNSSGSSITLAGPFPLSSATKPSTIVYLHVLPGTLTDFEVKATVGGKDYIGTVSASATINAGKMYTKTVEMQEVPFVVNTTIPSGAAYNYNGLEMQIGTWQSYATNPAQTRLAAAVIADGKAAFMPDVMSSLVEGSEIWICIPRVAKFFHTLTADDLRDLTLTLPDKDGGSTLKASPAVAGKPYENDWIVALYMGVNKDGAEDINDFLAPPIYWATGNIIATQVTGSDVAFHIADSKQTADESLTEDFDSYDPRPIGAQWNLFGWADATGVNLSTKDTDYGPNSATASVSGDTRYDIARAQLGGSWRLPTSGRTMKDHEFVAFADINGVSPLGSDWNNDAGIYMGRKYQYTISDAGSTGNTITNILWFPAAGVRASSMKVPSGSGNYWSGTSPHTSNGLGLAFSSNNSHTVEGNRSAGYTVRPVTE